MENTPTPAVDGLMAKVDTRYTMVILAARRARQILDGSRPQAGSLKDKPVTAALKELGADKVIWEPRTQPAPGPAASASA